MEEQKQIGTVEPIFPITQNPRETLSFVNGAVKKYGDDPACHQSLINYLNKIMDDTVVTEGGDFLPNDQAFDLGSGALELGEPIPGEMKKCIITRYDNTITSPPYKTIEIETVDIFQPTNDNLGEQMAENIREACIKRGHNFKFYSTAEKEGFDYEIVVWNKDYSM